MITALYGDILLPLDDAQGLGFNIFGLPSISPGETVSEQDMIQQQINVTDGQGVTKDGVEKMSVTILSPIFTFTDLRHRFKSLKWSFILVTGEQAYFAKKVGECTVKGGFVGTPDHLEQKQKGNIHDRTVIHGNEKDHPIY